MQRRFASCVLRQLARREADARASKRPRSLLIVRDVVGSDRCPARHDAPGRSSALRASREALTVSPCESSSAVLQMSRCIDTANGLALRHEAGVGSYRAPLRNASVRCSRLGSKLIVNRWSAAQRGPRRSSPSAVMTYTYGPGLHALCGIRLRWVAMRAAISSPVRLALLNEKTRAGWSRQGRRCGRG